MKEGTKGEITPGRRESLFARVLRQQEPRAVSKKGFVPGEQSSGVWSEMRPKSIVIRPSSHFLLGPREIPSRHYSGFLSVSFEFSPLRA